MHNNIVTSGILLINKPTNIVSFKVTKTVEKIFNGKSGHAGTLDPFADGLMIIGINKATRLLEYLSDANKEYIFTSKWGEETDTLDIDGKITKTESSKFNFNHIKQILPQFIGNIEQVPPQFSAIKINGIPMYKLARKGESKEIKARSIKIYELDNLENDYHNFTSSFRVLCSKGTYIRSLTRDIAKSLNTIGYTSKLRRTKIGNFLLSSSIDFDKLIQLTVDDIINSESFINLDKIRIGEHNITLTETEVLAFKQGKQILRNNLHFKESDVINTLFQDKLVGISKLNLENKNAISPIKVFI
ncbi:MAG: tRNA pseudouridine(55) synthase TruB [Rickettsiales bacterium]|nr:tRNA pseudouridine(55) synthase TruB [Rickettsiales bacterium]